MSAARAPVGRLAPSATGRLHLGHARTFLLAWWSLRARGGVVRMRLDDLDDGRVRPGSAEACLEDLRWLGLDWDGEVVHQSQDTGPLEEAVARLTEQGLLYPCVCSRSDIRAALSAPHAGTEVPYPGTCRGRWPSAAEAERETGRPAGLRFRVTAGRVEVEDAFAGPRSDDVSAQCGDFLVARRGGGYAYHLAVVVDDARMGVTEVLRGDDLHDSCARQQLLQDALGLPRPTWVHVPLVVDDDEKRLAKRTDALALGALREAGVDPRAVVGWVARSAGQQAPERLVPAELVEGFRLERVPKGSVRFGETELRALLDER